MIIASCKNTIKKEIQKYAETTKNLRILDIGCGDGEYTSMFCKNKNIVVGLDQEKRISKEYSNFKFINGNAISLPFPDNSFDRVVSFDVIEHINDDQKFLSEIFRVLKKDGKIFLETPNRERLSYRFLKKIGKPVKYPLVLAPKCIHVREYIYDELKNIFSKTGFRNLSIYNQWIGLRLKIIDIGLTKFPKKIDGMGQYYFVKAQK